MSKALDPLMDALADEVSRRVIAGVIAAIRDPAKPVADSRLVTITEAARILGRTPSSVRGLIATQQIPPSLVRRIGRRVFLDRAGLNQWIDAQQ